jgi:Xaa-Pro aminopeptidase
VPAPPIKTRHVEDTPLAATRLIDASRRRLKRLAATLRDRALGAYLATDPVEVAYLSNFGGDDSWLVAPARGRATLITDFRYAEDAAADCPHLAIVIRKGSLVDEVARLASGGRVPAAVSPDHVTIRLRRLLGRRLGAGGLKALPDVVRRMRMVKDDVEIRAVNRALRMTERSYADFLDRIRGGMTERRLAAELEYCFRMHGADGMAFATICAAGPNASRPHHRPGNRRWKATEPLLVDFGARVAGYVCDLTRMVLPSRIRGDVRSAYEAVLAAQEAAIAASGPGVLAVEVDAAARAVLRDHGLDKAFGHGTGHGFGREVHEGPAVSPKSGKLRLEPGMIITVEPGVYLPGRFGIRIEDDVLITEKGARVLSRLPKRIDDLRPVGRRGKA